MGLMDKLFPPDPEDVVTNDEAGDLSEAINAADPSRVAPAVSNPNAPQYVLVRPSEFNDAISVADHVIAHKTVVLNLNNTGKEIARRILDVLSGAAYAVRAKIKNVSVGTYLIIPYGSEFSGEGMDTIETDSFKLE